MAETICCGTAGVTSAEFQGCRTFGIFYAVHVPSTDSESFATDQNPSVTPATIRISRTRCCAYQFIAFHPWHSASRWSRLDRTVQRVHIRPTNNACCRSHRAFNFGIAVMGKTEISMVLRHDDIAQ